MGEWALQKKNRPMTFYSSGNENQATLFNVGAQLLGVTRSLMLIPALFSQPQCVGIAAAMRILLRLLSGTNNLQRRRS